MKPGNNKEPTAHDNIDSPHRRGARIIQPLSPGGAHDSLGPCESAPQTAFGSIQLFLHGSLVRPSHRQVDRETDRQTDRPHYMQRWIAHIYQCLGCWRCGLEMVSSGC